MLLRKTFTRQDILKSIHEFIESAKINILTINKVLLFGSYAKGNPHEYSNIDLAAFQNNSPRIHLKISGLFNLQNVALNAITFIPNERIR